MKTDWKGVLSYLGLAFGLAWILWEIPLRMGFEPGQPFFQFLVLPGAFSPAIAAVIVRKWFTKEGFGDAGLRLHLRHWRYYLVGWLLPLAVVGIILGCAVLFQIAKPDLTTLRALKTLAPENVAAVEGLPSIIRVLIPFQLLFTALIATPVLWGEEFGWRGYLQVRLFGDRPLLAAVATGLIWGVWHFPINLRGYNFPAHPYLGMIVFPVTTVMLSIIFGWLRLRTGSVWAPSLAHAATNAVGGSLTMLYFAGSGTDLLYISYVGLLGWIPLGLLSVWIVLTGRLTPPDDERNATARQTLPPENTSRT